MWKIEDFCETQTSRKLNSKMKFKTGQLEWKFTVVSNKKQSSTTQQQRHGRVETTTPSSCSAAVWSCLKLFEEQRRQRENARKWKFKILKTHSNNARKTPRNHEPKTSSGEKPGEGKREEGDINRSDKNKQMTHHQTEEFPTKFSKMKGRNIKQKNKRMTL